MILDPVNWCDHVNCCALIAVLVLLPALPSSIAASLVLVGCTATSPVNGCDLAVEVRSFESDIHHWQGSLPTWIESNFFPSIPPWAAPQSWGWAGWANKQRLLGKSIVNCIVEFTDTISGDHFFFHVARIKLQPWANHDYQIFWVETCSNCKLCLWILLGTGGKHGKVERRSDLWGIAILWWN